MPGIFHCFHQEGALKKLVFFKLVTVLHFVIVLSFVSQANIVLLLPVFEQFLDMAPDTSAHDTIRQSVIILMGCLARHLDKDDPKVEFVI